MIYSTKIVAALMTAVFVLSTTCFSQVIRSVGYNSTNGHIVASTGTNVLRFTNDVSFGGGPIITGDGIAYAQGTNVVLSLELQTLSLGGQTIFEWQTNQFIFSVPVNFNSTNTAAATRTNLGLGPFTAGDGFAELRDATNGLVLQVEDGVTLFRELAFGTADAPSNSRVNLGIPLLALTNTSNAAMMRALSGSTNTNHPYSGSISVVGTNNTNTLTFSNGILQSVQ